MVVPPAAPYWVKAPEDISLEEGASTEIECSAKGKPFPRVFWFINGRSLKGEFRRNVSSVDVYFNGILSL